MSSSRRMLGAGAAGVAAALVTAPLAHAAPAPSPTPQTAHGATSADQARQAPAPQASTTTSTAPVTPNYGFQKYRVGVQVKDGSYVPPGTSTAGTKLTITESGPGVTQQFGKDSITITCTTDASTAVAGSTATYCLNTGAQPALARALQHRYAPKLTQRPTPEGAPNAELAVAYPGDTVTITQTTVQPNLVTDPATAVLKPCVLNSAVSIPVCGTGTSSDDTTPLETDLVFDDAGLPPVAVDDDGKTEHGQSVTVDVTANDNTFGAPITGLSVVSAPKHGTATPIAGEGGPAGPTPSAPAPSTSSASSSASQSGSSSGSAPSMRAVAAARVTVVGTSIRYTPKNGFSGTDTFTYRISDANGSATARVTIRVAAAPSSAATSSASSSPTSTTTTDSASLSPSSTSRTLANTGTSSAQLGGLAALLLAAGGGLTVLGRRRYTGRHAGTR